MRSLFIGLNTIDLQFLVHRFPGPNKKSKAKKFGMYAGGPATNAAICHSYLGGKTMLASFVGQHQYKDLVINDLSTYHVELTDFASKIKCDPIFASVVTSDCNGERSIISYHPTNHKFDHIQIDGFKKHKFNIILTDGFYADLAVKLIKTADSNIPVVLDGGSWKKDTTELLPYIDMAICSADFKPPNTKNQHDVVDFLKNHGIKKIAISRGHDSILIWENGQMDELAVEQIDAVDTLGAGDFLHGAFCYYYPLSKDFKTALKMASKVASRSCMYFGTRDWMVHD